MWWFLCISYVDVQDDGQDSMDENPTKVGQRDDDVMFM